MATSKTFKPWEVDQTCLFPPSVRDFVPVDHLASLVRELVRNELDLSAIHDRYSELRGFPPYHPTMMTALLLYALCRGVYSSRARPLRLGRGFERLDRGRVDHARVHEPLQDREHLFHAAVADLERPHRAPLQGSVWIFRR